MKSHLAAYARVAVSLSILVLVFVRTPLEAVLLRARSAAWPALVAALLLVLVMALLVAVRWRWLAKWMGVTLPAGLAIRAMFLGLFAGQILPSAIGTDLLRGSVVARRTGQIAGVAASLVADRFVALFAACVLLLSSTRLPSPMPTALANFAPPLAVLASGTVLLVFLLGCAGLIKVKLPVGNQELVGAGRRGATPILAAIAVAVAVHAIAVATAVVTAAAYGVEASPRVWFSIVPMSIIACAVPISINGWGVRESVMVALAGLHGVAAPDALLVSLTLGTLNLFASLPGAYMLMRQTRVAT